MRQAAKPAIFRLLAALESLHGGEYDLPHPPAFIVGPPRSGSTVIRQALAWAIPTSYFSNFTASSCFALGRPIPITTAKVVITAGLVDSFQPLEQQDFVNDYGFSEGPGAPAEAELVWAHWFGSRYDPVGPGELSDERRRKIRRAVAATTSVFGRPFINKTTTLSVRIRALTEVFPHASFIRIGRDPVDTAQSILQARRTKYPDWIGARPRECAPSRLAGKSLLRQAGEQVFYVERHIARERRAVGEDRFLDVEYVDFCERPTAELERIATFLEARGVPAPIHRALPKELTPSRGRKVEESEYRRLKAILARLEAG